MGLRINQNVMAMNAYRNLTTSEGQLSRSLERLSSGFRINRAADDAAGLVISEGLRSQVMGLKMATRNAQDGVSVVQTAEGALTETHSILQRMRELAVQAASTGSSDQPSRDAAQTEVVQLKSELDRIAATTKFGQQVLLDGSYGGQKVRVTGIVDARGADTLAQTSDDGVTVGAGTTDTFSIQTDSMTGAGTATVAAGTYKTTASYQQALQTAVDQATSSNGGAAGDVKVDVTDDDGDGQWQVRFSRDVTSAGTESITITTTATPAAGVAAGVADTSGSPTGAGELVDQGGIFQVGSGTSGNDKIGIVIGNMGSTALGLATLDVSNSSLANTNISSIDSAITSVSTLRGNLGAYQNRFEHTISNLSVTTENLSASESRIRDTDMASEMMSFTRAQILQQAGTAMLSQANAVPQTVLQLLK